MRYGFRETPHTADWELYVSAPDLTALLEQAALGMNSLAGVEIDPAPPVQRTLNLQAADPEGLLVAFLSELLWLSENDHLAFDRFALSITAGGDAPAQLRLQAELTGGRIRRLDKEIKAVTWHNLAVRPTSDGVETSIVFDV